ncbi:hypothetical protein ACEWY4_027222 [Coilia grayii]|uniref:DEP domain-containing protein 7 n=1 Tax=Coilia grayii TaxID=363190 RepID=A0ABD1IVW2_9TELE
MATIRERAAALNLTGKLYSPMCPPPGLKHHHAGQTLVSWRNIVSLLQEQVQVERPWRHLRSHKNCFAGSDAVDIIQIHVQCNYFVGLDFSRPKAVRVCQALVDCGVIEPVGNRLLGMDKNYTFQDTTHSRYRFVSTKDASLDKLENVVISPFMQKSFDWSDTREKHMAFHSTPVKPVASCGAFARKDSFSQSSSHPTEELLPQSLISEVWQEQTLLCLMQIMELPFLESLLEAKDCFLQQSCRLGNDEEDALNISHLDWEILKAVGGSRTDEWLSAAIDCIGFLSDQVVVEVSRELPITQEKGLSNSLDIKRSKLLLFDALSKHYSHTDRPPLLGDCMGDVYTVIAEHVESGHLLLALEAIQLCLKLLPVEKREQLQKLLAFMALAAEPKAIKLHKEWDNRVTVKKTFSKAIVNYGCLSKDKSDLLVIFMMDNHFAAFQVPESLHRLVSEKLASIQQGRVTDAFSGPTYCFQPPESVHHSTKSELLKLLRTIDKDPKYSEKDKKRLFAKFYQGHPEVFAQYFGQRLSSVISTL